MAQAAARTRVLNRYFSIEHGFEPENYIQTVILYKRRNAQGAVERIAVKYSGDLGDPRDDIIDEEEDLLRRLWGSEHIIRLLSVKDDQYHQRILWAPPLNRNLLNPPSILSWKLTINPAHYPRANFEFFVTESLNRGTGEQLIERCKGMGIVEISEPLLWCFFLCLTRACIGMAYPPNRDNRNPPAVEREILPPAAQRASSICHSDLHLGNIMFGEYEFEGDQIDDCHLITPILKIIDFGLAHEDYTPEEAQGENLKCVGDLMHQLALVEKSPFYNDEDDRPTRMFENHDFETYATAEFCTAENLSLEFRLLVCRCLAVDEAMRPTLRRVLVICEQNVGLTPNWRNLVDEVEELFDIPLLDNDSDSGSEYLP